MSSLPLRHESVREIALAGLIAVALAVFVVAIGRCIQTPDTPKPIDPTGDGFYIGFDNKVVYAEGGRDGILIPNPIGDPEYLFIPPGAVASWNHSNAVPVSTEDLH